jgi:sugar phosphate isomerase/epimerase
MISRKKFIGSVTAATLAGLLPFRPEKSPAELVDISSYIPKFSLSQWALNRMQFGSSKEDNYNEWKKNLRVNSDLNLQGTLHPLDFPQKANELGYNAVEYVNTFFFDKAKDQTYLNTLNANCEKYGIQNLLIMVDEEGFLGDKDSQKRDLAVEAHKKWVDAAAQIGCFAIRVNAHGNGSWDEQKIHCAESLKKLCAYAHSKEMQILIENHGGLSSHPVWLLEMMGAVGAKNLGIMNDFDNFEWSETQIWGSNQRYNRYLGFEQLLPFTQSVSAKAHHFDMQGFETSIDFHKMAQIIAAHDYSGFISIEFEGNYYSEIEGISLTKNLLIKSFNELK